MEKNNTTGTSPEMTVLLYRGTYSIYRYRQRRTLKSNATVQADIFDAPGETGRHFMSIDLLFALLSFVVTHFVMSALGGAL